MIFKPKRKKPKQFSWLAKLKRRPIKKVTLIRKKLKKKLGYLSIKRRMKGRKRV